MNYSDYATYTEITTQPKAWSQAMELASNLSLLNLQEYHSVTIIGCGSTYYLSLAIASLLQSLSGKQVRAVPSSELLLNSESILPRNRDESANEPLLIAFSRSGTTSETIKAVELYKSQNKGFVLSISNYGETLAQLSDASLIISEGEEKSIAQTRSFSSMFLAGVFLSAKLAGRNDLVALGSELPAIGERLIDTYEELAKDIGSDLSYENFYLLGSGYRYGLACELSLKLKEMSLSNSEPFHFMEFRHGPMSMVNDKVGLIGLVSEKNRGLEKNILEEMKALGSRNITLGETETDIAFMSNLPDQLVGVLYLPVFQMVAFFRSIEKGLNPDKPHNLSAVVKLDLSKEVLSLNKS